ncbi:hypothetical protein AB0H94_35895 [Streptomyces purpurascens]|uniref:hypothetical protein n=1 Tax=Streptomyces purpurascens TaxID=1924 RepID=UPI0033F4F3A1
MAFPRDLPTDLMERIRLVRSSSRPALPRPTPEYSPACLLYRRYHAWRAPFPLWARIACDILFWAVIAAAAYVAIGSLCGAILIAAPLLGFLGLASSKEHDDGIDWSNHRMGGQPKNPGPKI